MMTATKEHPGSASSSTCVAEVSSSLACSRKRKRVPVIADPYARIAASGGGPADLSTSKSGRGSEAGWTHCPICFPLSKKVFARGRGIASHLHSVHTPWKAPSKAERKRRKQLHERKLRQKRQAGGGVQEDPPPIETRESWEPTTEEVEEWNSKVLQMVQDLEENPLIPEATTTTSTAKRTANNNNNNNKQSEPSRSGLDRNGQTAKSYKASLPPFLQAASDGDYDKLQEILNSCKTEVLAVLNQTDRHGSIAEHWAAGGGHLDCLKLLKETRRQVPERTDDKSTSSDQQQQQQSSVSVRPTKMRRRDGKTSLHYAARNGRIECIEYLLQDNHHNEHSVDEVSGDGTTPFHLACFGAHPKAMELLVQRYGACPTKPNDWGCTAAHWVAMSKNDNVEQVVQACRLLSQSFRVGFTTRQSQGHSPLHKAAQRQNRHVIEWMATSRESGGAGLAPAERRVAGQPDEGGYTPSDIWKSVGGDRLFGEWMKHEMGW